jgi:hypothetical protein
MKLSSFLVLSMAVAACGSGSGQTGTVQAVCDAMCDWQIRCNQNPGESRETCIASCAADSPSASTFKPGVLSTWAGCFGKLECTGRDDECLLEVVVSQNPNWEAEPKSLACEARKTECDGTGSGVSFTDDQCVAYILCTETVTAQVDACLAGACDTISACLDSTLQW